MQPYPLRFRPILKRTLWGGRRLAEQLGKATGPESDYGESWEVVDHRTDQSIVENGPLAGQSLAALLARDPQWLLGCKPGFDSFPLLLKYLDCHRVLSVQVHPDDAYAMAMQPPDLGKTEAWYIVASQPESLIYAGLRSGVDRAALQRAVEAGETEQVLHSFHPEPGDVVFIPSGTVHALGAGLLLVEIQQSSDTTFRLFDWNRLGEDGRPRTLHVAESLEVTDYGRGPVQPQRTDPDQLGWQTLVDCDKFVLRAMHAGRAPIGGDGKFHILTVPQGTATLEVGSQLIQLGAGETRLLPASLAQSVIKVHPGGVMLGMHLPD